MTNLWLVLLAVVIGGWSVLDGFGLGTGMLLPAAGAERSRRQVVLTAFGPFFLAGEVWLIVGAGVLVGAFPAAEAALFAAGYPALVALLVAWVLRDAAMWLRNRRPEAGWTRGWDHVLVMASAAFAAAWGLLLGTAVRDGGQGDRATVAALLHPFPLLCAVTVALLFATHGAAFTAVKVPGPTAERMSRVGRTLALTAALAGTAVFLTGLATERVRAGAGPATAVLCLVAVVAAAAAAPLFRADRPGLTFAATAVGAVAPTLAAGAALAPVLRAGAAPDGTLTGLAVLAVPVIALVLAVQAVAWWFFRRPVGQRSVTFF